MESGCISIQHFSGNISIGDLKLDRLVVTTGDFDGDMQDEAVLGFRLYFWEYEYDHPELMYRTFAYEYLLPFSINDDLTHLEFDPANRYWGYGNPTLKQWDGPPPESTTDSNLCLVSGDLNGDTRDEIVFRRGRWLSTFEASNSLHLNRILNDYWPFIDWNFESHRTLAITDLDADSTALDWQPEIFWLEFADDSRNMYIRVGKPILDANNQITSILWLTTSQPVTVDNDYFLTAADMDGDAIKLGKPKRILKESVFQPIVILNSPPVHFDILNNQPYDICLAFNANAPSCLFNSHYGTVAGTGTEVQTNVHADWGVSASLSGGFKPLGIVVNANLGTKYGEGFSWISTLQNEITITSEASAKQDDRIYTQEVDYSLWEYPIYCQGEKKGNLLAVFPHLTNESWFPAKQDDPGRHFLLRHETGNIFSYPYYSDPLNNPEVDTLIGVDIERTVAADYTTPMLWGVSMQYLNISQVDTTKEVGLSVGASVSGWGLEVKTEANYDRQEISTHKISFNRNVWIESALGSIDPAFGNIARYKVTPYAYWDTNGALVLDYLVRPELSGGGPANWWLVNYGNLPDPALNLPWRYDPEKGIFIPEDERYQTKELTFNPKIPEAGDTALVRLQVHNYSLVATADPVLVKFYMDDPDNGGKVMVDLSSDSVFTTAVPVAAQSKEIVQMYWRVPATLLSGSKIYAVLDPGNSMTEVHENNNKGWTDLTIIGAPNSIDDRNRDLPPNSYALYQNYPNPFNPPTTIEFYLPKTSNVTLKIFNILGEEVATLVSEQLVAGRYTCEWDASSLSSGIYIPSISRKLCYNKDHAIHKVVSHDLKPYGFTHWHFIMVVDRVW